MQARVNSVNAAPITRASRDTFQSHLLCTGCASARIRVQRAITIITTASIVARTVGPWIMRPAMWPTRHAWNRVRARARASRCRVTRSRLLQHWMDFLISPFQKREKERVLTLWHVHSRRARRVPEESVLQGTRVRRLHTVLRHGGLLCHSR